MAAPEPGEQSHHLPGRERSQVRAALDGYVGDSPRLLVVLVGVRLKPSLRVVGAFDVVDDLAIAIPAKDVRARAGEVQWPSESPGERDVQGSQQFRAKGLSIPRDFIASLLQGSILFLTRRE